MVKENGSYIVEMAIEGEETPSTLIGPNLYLIVVSTGHEQWLGLMKINASDRSVMLLEPIYQRSHPIVPKLNGGRVQ